MFYIQLFSMIQKSSMIYGKSLKMKIKLAIWVLADSQPLVKDYIVMFFYLFPYIYFICCGLYNADCNFLIPEDASRISHH